MRMDHSELAFYMFVHIQVENCVQGRSAAESLKVSELH